MKHVTFVTGSDRKIQHMREACAEYGITVEQRDLGMDEIQSHDPHAISRHKATQAFALAGGDTPVVINDSFWTIPALKGFPGGYMKDVNEWFDSEDFIALMAGKADRRICCTETVIYMDGTQTKTFTKEFWCEVITGPPRGEGDAVSRVVAVDGKTIAEYHNQGKMAFAHYIWHDFAEWLVAQS